MATHLLSEPNLNLGPEYYRLEGVFMDHMARMEQGLGPKPDPQISGVLDLCKLLAGMQAFGLRALHNGLTEPRMGLGSEELEELLERLGAVQYELERIRTGAVEKGELLGLAEMLGVELGDIIAALEPLEAEEDKEEAREPEEHAPLAGLDL